MRSPPRGKRRRVAAAPSAVAGLLLSACAPALAPEALTVSDLRRASAAGETMVVARFHRADTGAGIFVGGPTSSVPAFIWRMEDRREARFGAMTGSPAAGAAGWVAQGLVPGSYYMEVGGGMAQAEGRAFTFSVPAGGGVAYIGSFPFACPYTTAAPCLAISPPQEEATAARPALPEVAGPRRAVIASPFRRDTAHAAWPAPMRIETGIDRVAVQTAVDWDDFASRAGSRGTFRAAGGIAGLGMSAGQAGQAGAIIAVPFFVGALGVVAVGGLVAGAEAIHRAQVERQWQPCLDALGEQAAPSMLERRMAEALSVPPGPSAARRGGDVPASAWQVQLTRVVLRRCAGAGLYGVEVGMRWTAPGREARFMRRVDGAPDVPGLASSSPARWETPTDGDAPCRPLAEYCRPEGEPLVMRDVIDAVAAARDAILGARRP